MVLLFFKEHFIVFTQRPQSRVKNRGFLSLQLPHHYRLYYLLKSVHCIACDSESCLGFFVCFRIGTITNRPFQKISNKILISSKGSGQDVLHADLSRLRLPLRRLKHCKYSLAKITLPYVPTPKFHLLTETKAKQLI